MIVTGERKFHYLRVLVLLIELHNGLVVVSDEVTFYKLVKDAYHASYGYEFLKEILSLARENLLVQLLRTIIYKRLEIKKH